VFLNVVQVGHLEFLVVHKKFHTPKMEHNLDFNDVRASQSCKRASIWSPNPARDHKPELGPRPTLIFEARKPNLPNESRYAQLRCIKKRSARA